MLGRLVIEVVVELQASDSAHEVAHFRRIVQTFEEAVF
jgi:hypothetical protein